MVQIFRIFTDGRSKAVRIRSRDYQPGRRLDKRARPRRPAGFVP